MSDYNNHNNEPVNVLADKKENTEIREAAEAEYTPKEKERITLTTELEEETPELVVELSKIYAYDDEEINEIDLTGIDNISDKDQKKAMKLYRKIADNVSVNPEFTTDYAVAITHVLTEIPIEIIKQFSFKDKIRLKNAIMGFLYSDN